MISWVDHECRSWAAHKRWLMFGSHGWPDKSVLGKLMVEGPGAGDNSFRARVPIHDDPQSYTDVNIALVKMAETHEMERPWLVIHAHYVCQGKAKQKAPVLKMSIQQYWQQLHAAHAFIAAVVPRETESSRQEFPTALAV